MRAYVAYVTLALVFIFGVFFINNRQAIPVITYFPYDSTHSFTDAQSTITLTRDKEKFEVVWDSISRTDNPLYLRQDVSLLYINGVLSQVRNKWREKSEEIHFQKTIQGEEDSYFQAISFHYGESHYKKEGIKSIHQMSHDQLYVTKENNTLFTSFKNLSDGNERSKQLDKKTKQKLLVQWSELIDHYHINVAEYQLVPLTDLPEFVHTGGLPIPKKHTTQIIGQLWEGLYKNYIMPTIEQKEHSCIPIVLFDKDETHLLVLFKINNKYNKLIQQYPTS